MDKELMPGHPAARGQPGFLEASGHEFGDLARAAAVDVVRVVDADEEVHQLTFRGAGTEESARAACGRTGQTAHARGHEGSRHQERRRNEQTGGEQRQRRDRRTGASGSGVCAPCSARSGTPLTPSSPCTW